MAAGSSVTRSAVNGNAAARRTKWKPPGWGFASWSSSNWLCIWPGLVRLWLKGDFFSLLVASSFALLLNLSLLSTFVWTQWLGEYFPAISWPVLLAFWVGSLIVSRRALVEFESNTATHKHSDALFIAAQTEYLKKNWIEAEALLTRRLRNSPRDIESRILLASVLRRLQRFDQAKKHLIQLGKFDESAVWREEIEQLFDSLRGDVELLTNSQTDNDRSLDDDETDIATNETVKPESESLDSESNNEIQILTNETTIEKVIKANSETGSSKSNQRRAA